MPKIYAIPALILFALALLSNSTNPPNGKTGAPGESFCTECHTPSATSLDGSITVDGFPAVIEPNQTYQLTVTNSNTAGNGVKAGFQMTVLGPLNTKAGEMKNPSASSTVMSSLGRQYFEHNPAPNYPVSRQVSWTVDWTAPDLAAGSVVTWYAAGNIANGNFSDTGDKVVAANGTGTYMLSSTGDGPSIAELAVYPNPGSEEIYVSLPGTPVTEGIATFITLDGRIVKRATVRHGHIQTGELPSGMYIFRLELGGNTTQARWVKL